MKYWLPVVLVSLGTFLYRYSFIGVKITLKLPELVKECLNFVPVSVMAALVALGFFVDGGNNFFLSGPHIITALVAALIALRYRRDLLTIIIGLAVYWLAEILL